MMPLATLTPELNKSTAGLLRHVLYCVTRELGTHIKMMVLKKSPHGQYQYIFRMKMVLLVSSLLGTCNIFNEESLVGIIIAL